MTSDKLKIGTSGFSYRDWLGNFYPQFCPQSDYLRFYAMQFPTVELDVTFYRIPTESMIARWVDVTPDRFVFAAKFPRTVTHGGDLVSRLADCDHFCSVMRGMGDKLGPLLMQFPYSFKPDQFGLLETLINRVPSDLRLSVEVRNRKWLTDDLYSLLQGRNIALCLVDHPWMPRISVRTADFLYFRFLGDHKKITEDFSYIRDDREDELGFWSQVIDGFAGENRQIFAYFNNHFSGHAPTTAERLRRKLDELRS